MLMIVSSGSDVVLEHDRQKAFQEQLDDVRHAAKRVAIGAHERVLEEQEEELDLQIRRRQERVREWSLADVLRGIRELVHV